MKRIASILIALATLPFHLFASDDSVKVLEQINLARVSPSQYADILAQRMQGVRTRESRVVEEAISFLKKTSPLPPLTYSEGMASGAMRHVEDQGSKGTFGHAGSDRSTPWDRMAGRGKWVGCAGENISYGFSDPAKIVAQLIVDDGVRGRGHRKNIFNRGFGVAGIAVGPHARFGAMCVIDFAGGFVDNGTLGTGVALTANASAGSRHTIAAAWSRQGLERL